MDAPRKTARERAARCFERAHELVDRARGAASRGKLEKAEEMRRKGNKAMKKALVAMGESARHEADDGKATADRAGASPPAR